VRTVGSTRFRMRVPLVELEPEPEWGSSSE
jgi:hypothetical protein